MKLKKYGAALLGLLLAASMAACGTTKPETVDPTAEPTNAPASDPVVLEPTAPTDEPAMNPTDDPADAEDDPAGGQTGLPNPRMDYADAAKLNAALGFTVIELDADAGYTAKSFAAIDGKVGEILYRDEGGAELCLRTAKASDGMDAEALSGVYGATFTDESTEKLQRRSGEHDGTLVLWFSDGTTACSLTAEGISAQDFADVAARILPAG